MSLYHMLFGTKGYPLEIMGLFGLEPDMVGRYRDHWLERAEDDEHVTLALYTRMGGGNREEYADKIEQMHALPTFVEDHDDAFDATYSTLRFIIDKESAIAWFNENTSAIEDGLDASILWEECIREAVPERYEMAPVWEAMLASMAGGVDESVEP